MKKILMITYNFPPFVTVGAIRPLKFAKYLPKFGWDPVILTVNHPGPFTRKLDHQFMKNDVKNIKVYKSFGFPLVWVAKGLRLFRINSKWFFIPDPHYGWFLHSVLLGKRIIKKEKIDVIYATSPPPTSLLIGVFLKKICNKPLIIDYRDLWTGNPFVSYPTKFHFDFEKKIEGWVLKHAEIISVVNNNMKRKLLRTFPFLDESKIVVIPNGYDPEDFKKVTPQKFKKFTILHAGSIYGHRVKYFKLLLEVINELIQEGSVLIEDFQLIFVGYLARAAKKILNRMHLPNVYYLGVKNHEETIRFMLGADVLLLIPGTSETLTSKIFEYLAAKKFILNISDENGQASRFIERMKAGKTVTPLTLYKTLRDILTSKNVRVTLNSNELDKFSKPNLTKLLASKLELIYLKTLRK
ncbi:glycosyltransferase family 4 protein [Candidatus Bathyarchaeota archaeon]|nr:glycosyltransferase family 4 protein [Candidatus Bathyarchaeota archaeon]